jgi:hypothetical protein
VLQQLSCHRREGGIPFRDDGRKLGQPGGPLVGALQPKVRFGWVGQRFTLGTDVELFAPVDRSTRELPTEARVAAEVWAVHHCDRVLVGLG